MSLYGLSRRMPVRRMRGKGFFQDFINPDKWGDFIKDTATHPSRWIDSLIPYVGKPIALGLGHMGLAKRRRAPRKRPQRGKGKMLDQLGALARIATMGVAGAAKRKVRRRPMRGKGFLDTVKKLSNLSANDFDMNIIPKVRDTIDSVTAIKNMLGLAKRRKRPTHKGKAFKLMPSLASRIRMTGLSKRRKRK